MMEFNEGLDTKERIKLAARELFALQTFEGTSIREIADLAQVNVSAINYHFQNKENLYYEILFSCYSEMELKIANIYKELGHDFFKFMLATYSHFLDDGHAIKSNFSLFLNNSLDFTTLAKEQMLGPPGEKSVLKALKQHCPKSKESDLAWMIKTIYSFMIHTTLIASSSMAKKKEIAHRWSKKQLMEDFEKFLNKIA